MIDNYGRLIASYPEASDYYQGDEAKFIRSTTDRQPFIDHPDWDDSSGSVAIQVSTPVFEQKNLIGVMVHTIEVNLRILTGMEAK